MVVSSGSPEIRIDLSNHEMFLTRAVTAFSVPFSSFTAFIAYAAMGSVSLKIMAFAGMAAWGGGYLGTKFMQTKMHPQTVKRILGGALFLIALKLAWTLLR